MYAAMTCSLTGTRPTWKLSCPIVCWTLLPCPGCCITAQLYLLRSFPSIVQDRDGARTTEPSSANHTLPISKCQETAPDDGQLPHVTLESFPGPTRSFWPGPSREPIALQQVRLRQNYSVRPGCSTSPCLQLLQILTASAPASAAGNPK